MNSVIWDFKYSWCKTWVKSPYHFVKSEFRAENILVDWVTQFNASYAKISRIQCFSVTLKYFNKNNFKLMSDLWKPFMPSKMSKHLKNIIERSCISQPAIFYDLVGLFSKRTETSLDCSEHNANTQIWSNYNRVQTIPWALILSSGIPVLLLNQPSSLVTKLRWALVTKIQDGGHWVVLLAESEDSTTSLP